jgi:hypothetical protein
MRSSVLLIANYGSHRKGAEGIFANRCKNTLTLFTAFEIQKLSQMIVNKEFVNFISFTQWVKKFLDFKPQGVAVFRLTQ